MGHYLGNYDTGSMIDNKLLSINGEREVSDCSGRVEYSLGNNAFTSRTRIMINLTTKEQRRQHIATMRANFGLEGIHPNAEDLVWQDRYIDGTASFDDLLKYNRAFAKVRSEREDAANFARASVGLEGLTPSENTEAFILRFVNGEISFDELCSGKPNEGSG